MRVLVLGANGLIGHKLFYKLGSSMEVYGTIKRPISSYRFPDSFNLSKIIDKIDLFIEPNLHKVVNEIKPDVILNCAGITKRKIGKENRIEAIYINSCLPHVLAQKNPSTRIIHFSTDCVFNGESGNYTENSPTNANDLYGKSKALGELVDYDNALTIRSSFIGRELAARTELLEWALQQAGKRFTGYKNALYTGVTTNYLTDVVANIITLHKNLCGLYQLGNPAVISKYNLLKIIDRIYNLGCTIDPDDEFECDATLLGTKLVEKIGIKVPSWEEMLLEVWLENSLYDN